MERQELEKSVLSEHEKDLQDLERLEKEIVNAENRLYESKVDEDKFLEDKDLDILEKENSKVKDVNEFAGLDEIEEEIGRQYMDEDLNAKENPYFGSIVGRYGNRIKNGTFSVDDKSYVLAKNNNMNHLHGGIKGFDSVIWEIENYNSNQVTLSYLSPDGDEGYPGELKVKVK